MFCSNLLLLQQVRPTEGHNESVDRYAEPFILRQFEGDMAGTRSALGRFTVAPYAVVVVRCH